MIISKAPLRLTLAGGGTDLPSYYQTGGSSWISVSIDKFCFSQINPSFNNNFLIKYSEYEKCDSVDQIKHPLIREALKFIGVNQPLELTFSADLPGSTGLGSSGSFLVSLLKALHDFKGEEVTSRKVAEEATEIEMNILSAPIGLQDQYISAVGGLKEFIVDKRGKLDWFEIDISKNNAKHINEHLKLFFTGTVRDSKLLLSEQVDKSISRDTSMIDQLDYVKNKVTEIKECLIMGDEIRLGRLFDEHWKIKKQRSKFMSTSKIDSFYSDALKIGALGGKIVGAGGGGFILLVCRNNPEVTNLAKKYGYKEIGFNFEYMGASRILSV